MKHRPKLDDLYIEYGLTRPNQFKKIPLAERDQWEAVSFQWGQGLVVGWRKADG